MQGVICNSTARDDARQAAIRVDGMTRDSRRRCIIPETPKRESGGVGMTHRELPWCDVNSPRPAACVGLGVEYNTLKEQATNLHAKEKAEKDSWDEVRPFTITKVPPPF